MTPEPVEATLARIEVKLDSVMLIGSDHEKRIRALEQKVWYAAGFAAAAGAGITQLLQK